EQADTPGQNQEQLDQLFSLISRSQQGYRDLIDTFEDLLFSTNMDGRILAANRSFADLLNCSFADLIGRSIDDFLEFPGYGGSDARGRVVGHFTERRRWTGV